MDLKEDLLKLIENVPIKQWAKRVNANTDIKARLIDATDLYKTTNISEMLYIVLVGPPIITECGKKPIFNSFNLGYRQFCGQARTCECARNSVSQKVSADKQSYSAEKKKKINDTRVKTTMLISGVTNNGQTVKAKLAHKEVYADINRVTEINKQVADTKERIHGNRNYNNSEQIRKTWHEKYDLDYWVERLDNENVRILKDKTQLETLYKQYTPYEIAKELGFHVQTIYKYLNEHELRDPYKSSEELEVVRFLESLGITNIIRNTRKLLPSKKEIDIYLPDYKLAIEYNGIYWHHEDIPHIDKQYHFNKYNECKNLGIQLITLFSSVWKSRKDVVKRSLISKLGLNKEYIRASKCQIREVDPVSAGKFLEQYHVQGNAGSQIKYGLYYKDQLVCIMTFGNTRIGIGKREDGYELIRFASSYRVMGGASKLLKHFIAVHAPSKIISYSDNEWSDGGLYKTLNFTLENEIKPSYWYITNKRDQLCHRMNYAKHKLVENGADPALSEMQITKELGFLRVWDCGKKRWVLNCV